MSVKVVNQFSLSTLLTLSLLSLSLSNPDSTTLLDFKSASDPSNSLSSWFNSSNHCLWLGVTCDPLTHRVTKLVLNGLNLTGSIQPLTRLPHLRHLRLHHNRLSTAPHNLSSWPNLKHLYLSHNLIAGKFPAGISNLRRLLRLDLSHNKFSGEIPVTELTQLPHLLTVRFDCNSFTGSLNSGESYSNSISEFNVSENKLSGEIPNWLSKFPATSFAGNRNLCGEPLPSNCSGNNRTVSSDSVQISVPSERKDGLSDRVVLMIISIAAAVMATLVAITWCLHKRVYGCRERNGGVKGKSGSRWRGVVRVGEEMVCFEGCRGFTNVDELLRASAEMLGKGSVGATYKVVMDGGDVVVVKRVKGSRKRKEVDGFLREIGGLRHPNVVSLRAYYYSLDELLLVYDFLPNGSLHSLLHENRGPGRTPLDWTTRLKLASQSAQAMAFLHSHNKYPNLFHGHLTTSNILVNRLGNASVSDTGLHQLLPPPSSSNNHNAKLMQKHDVYSFGVVILEILTGKVAPSEGENRTRFLRWAESMVGENRSWEVLDFELLRYKEREEEMVALLRVALLCLAPLPRERPEMGKVLEMIEDIRRSGDGGGGGNRCSGNDLSSDLSPSQSESTPNFTSS
ncbi:Leucine-rich repeat receptor-like protein kinase precursor [Actinidia chinensis var. chinensis]|uniref:Leucine-rich repeat receptor-like protein kinase n=1 Tax=Actinidia chinensis var. chinensis TaxID=1590841 RepID=A0A2R6PHF7_ACTCC|nr:Leucine-rich repeat receptor-like protein kinase precursor [Actinidia chinensis var. chinensis]